MTYGFLTKMDRSKEKSTASFTVANLAADGSNYAAITASVAAIIAAIEGVTSGNSYESAVVATRTRISNEIPVAGQREDKWLVRMEDDVTKKIYTMELPIADDSKVVYSPGTDFWDLGSVNAEMTAFVAAVNTHMKAPDGVNAVTLISVQRVGRNN